MIMPRLKLGTFPSITEEQREFIRSQHMFFVATATDTSRINVSPKGVEGLRVMSDRQVAYLDLTGSGSETAAHLRADGRLTFMICAFDETPIILRLYGRGSMIQRGHVRYADLRASLFGDVEMPGARQIVMLDVDLVQTSCGFGVPFYRYEGQRTGLVEWAEDMGAEGMESYRRKRNTESLDGLPTGFGDVPA